MANSRIFFGTRSDNGIVNDWTIASLHLSPTPGTDQDHVLEGIAPEDWLKCWSTLDDRARLVVDGTRTLLCADKRGRLVLRPGGGLRLRDRRVEPANAADLPAFEDLMLSKSSSESLCLNGSHGCGHLILQAVKISESRGKRLVGIASRNVVGTFNPRWRSEEHTSELQSLIRNSYAVFCCKKNTHINL